jgi:hypothetical protein
MRQVCPARTELADVLTTDPVFRAYEVAVAL